MITRSWLMDEWRDTFVTQARLHNVSGPKIGEALAEIDTHCADSGQSPYEAFGDPVDYAQAIARELPPTLSGGTRSSPWIQVLMAFATLGGILCLLEGVDAATHGVRGVLTAGELLSVAAGTVAIAVIATVVLRPGQRDVGWRLGVAVAVGLAATMSPHIIWTAPVIHVRGWALLTTGLLLLALAWWPRAANRLIADRILDPRTGNEPFRAPRLIIAATRWGLPIILLCAVLLIVLVPGSSR